MKKATCALATALDPRGSEDVSTTPPWARAVLELERPRQKRKSAGRCELGQVTREAAPAPERGFRESARVASEHLDHPSLTRAGMAALTAASRALELELSSDVPPWVAAADLNQPSTTPGSSSPAWLSTLDDFAPAPSAEPPVRSSPSWSAQLTLRPFALNHVLEMPVWEAALAPEPRRAKRSRKISKRSRHANGHEGEAFSKKTLESAAEAPSLARASSKNTTHASGIGLALALLFAAQGAALGAGLAVDVQSGRATGMAAAVAADVNEPSAVLFNPAAIIRKEGQLDLQIGDTLLFAANRFTPVGGEPISGTTPVIPPFHLYGTYGLTENWSIGAGLFSPFGLRIRWPTDWIGEQLIRRASLTAYYFNPEVAYRFGCIQIGAGVQIVRSTVELRRAVSFVDSVGEVKLAAGAWGAGGNVGVLVNAIPDFLSVAATYRSRVKLKFNNGTAHFSDVPPEFAGSGPGQLRDQSASTQLTLPDTVALAFSVQPIKGLHLNFETDYYAWQVFSALEINFEDPALNVSEPKLWHHTWNFHFGGEYEVLKNFFVRAGLLWDPTPSPDETLGPDVPDSSRINLAAGVGYTWKDFTVDLGYQHILFLNKTSTLPALPGTYGGNVNVLSLSLRYQFNLKGL